MNRVKEFIHEASQAAKKWGLSMKVDEYFVYIYDANDPDVPAGILNVLKATPDLIDRACQDVVRDTKRWKRGVVE